MAKDVNNAKILVRSISAGSHDQLVEELRWLEADGRIGGMSSVVATGKAGTSFWPTMDRAPDGTFWVGWQQNPDKEGDDLFLRHLDADLKPLGNEIRATD